MPPPARDDIGPSDRIRLVDPTGCAVAWLAYGEALVVLGFFVRDDDGTWREVLHEWIVDAGRGSQAWTLVVRDPTMAALRREGGARTDEIMVEIDNGTLVIQQEGHAPLRFGNEGHLAPDSLPIRRS